MEVLESRVKVLENTVNTIKENQKEQKQKIEKVEDKQNEMYTDIKVTKEVVLQLKEGWSEFDKTRKDNFNKLSFQIIYLLISAAIGSLIGYITGGKK